jgi:hypothetical protein
MGNKDNKKYTVLSIVMFLAIIAIIIFVIIPKYSPVTPEKIVNNIDFSNPTWIEKYVDKSVGVFGKDFFLNTAFSYTQRSNKIAVAYASKKSVDEARNFYLAIPGAKQIGRNDETSLDITAEKDGQGLRVYNFFSPISRVFKLDLNLSQKIGDKIKIQLDNAFPADVVAKIPEIKDLVSGELYGGYVRYQYDNLDEFAYPNIPIFSRAYLFNGTEENFNTFIEALKSTYQTNKYDETQDTYYFQIDGHIVSISLLTTDSNEKIVTLGIQKMKNK